MSTRQFTRPKSKETYGAVFDSDVRHATKPYRTESVDYDGNASTDDNLSDNDMPSGALTGDEFGGRQNYYQQKGTGRQRKKVASRGKGSEFQAKRKKRRVYACCIGSEIDTLQLVEHFKNAPDGSALARSNWSTEMYTDTLRIYRNSILVPSNILSNSLLEGDDEPVFYSYATGESKGLDKISVDQREKVMNDLSIKFHDPYCKEIFVFGAYIYLLSIMISLIIYCESLFCVEFGAVVFWGFPIGEQKELLDVFREFVSKGRVTLDEALDCDDDMAFITVGGLETTSVTISNDVMSVPDDTSAKQRLALSFAMGQSTILAVFESRVESKVQEYKYIPETLASSGKIKIPSKKIGTMIGEIFVIRHDLNLHTDILDTPDFFWEEDKYVPEYKMLWRYLEMDGRVEVLNKRLDMLKELLDVLQQQMENAHASKLEWIVIWLIVIEVIVELGAIASGKMFS